MSVKREKRYPGDSDVIHQHYMDIINALADIVYWVDVNCNLIGCNNNFVNLLGIQELRDFKGTPYQQMDKCAHWQEQRIETFRLDDMKVIFSGEARTNVEEQPIIDEKGKTLYFKSNRVPMFDEGRNVIGMVVVLTDIGAIKKLEERLKPEPQQERQFHDNLVKNGRLPTILMIEDNIIAQNVEKALLTGLNCHVDIADTGDKALKLFDPGKYDLVLMDIGLEDTSGYVVAKQLRSMEKDTDHHVPIIALTGYEADVVKYDCEQYFMEGAITKPLTSTQAEQIIKHYVYHQDVSVDGLKRV
ncbi:response regulator [Legionella fallonii]|nr:PAS domain-containing protein [Legionella fallonii]